MAYWSSPLRTVRRPSIRARWKCRRRKISPSLWKSGPSAAWGSFSPLKEWTASTTAARATAISTSSRSGRAMTEVTPAKPSRPTPKRRSIKTKILLALLVVSLAPLILFAGLGRYAMNTMREHVRAELVRHAREELVLLAKNQAAFVSAVLDKVEVETGMVAFFTQALLRDP